MGFKNWKVSSKIIFGFGVLLIFAASIGIVGVLQLNRIQEGDSILLERGTKPLKDVIELATIFQRTRVNLRDILRSTSREKIEFYENRLMDLQKDWDLNLEAIRPTLATEEGKAVFKRIAETWIEYSKARDQIIAHAKASKQNLGFSLLDGDGQKTNQEMQREIDSLTERKIQFAMSLGEANAKTANSATYLMFTLLAVGALIAIGIAIYISKEISSSLNKISSNLMDSAHQVASAATQLSTASSQLSSSSSEQASAVEETSSSLEELNGMVQNNVSNAEQAFTLATRVRDLSESGCSTMDNLELAMKEILASNEKIDQLVKVIGNIGEKTEVMDEIVFQTKLLSFNASVEAERAGEYGRGFAVVAQEVGNLAQMSGKAAQEIANIVKESIKNAETITAENKRKVEQGNHLVVETGKNLKEIMSSASTVSGGAKQVLDASKDQAKGIAQINTAMTQVDKVTQENAATAEEAASSSEELNAQTEVLNQVVTELQKLVNGRDVDVNLMLRKSEGSPSVYTKKIHPTLSAKKTISHSNVTPIQKHRVDSNRSNSHDNLQNGLTGTDDGWEKL